MASSSSSVATPPPPATTTTTTSTRRTIKGPSLVEIKTKHYLQCSNPLTISSFATLIAELNSSREEDHRIGNQLQRDERIDHFRQEWILGALSRVKPLALLEDGESEVYSDGAGATRTGSETASVPSVLADDDDEEDGSARTNGRIPLDDEARAYLLPPDAISRGLLAERSIKRSLSLLHNGHLFLRHRDFSSLATVARRAMRRTLQTGKPVYVSPGLVEAVDWTGEYTARGWAAPGVRWSVFRPDLIKFQEMRGGGGTGGSKVLGGGESRQVTWEVVEIKYSNKPRDFIYTNLKIQAVFYHLSLSRILSAVPSLHPSHKVTFFLSRDPLSPSYEERSVSLRTEQAFVEHHLFVLLPSWLEAVRSEEWERLQEALRTPVVKPLTNAPSTPQPADQRRQTFLEKLQASVKAAPPSPSRPRRRPPTTLAPPSGQAGAAAPTASSKTTEPSSLHSFASIVSKEEDADLDIVAALAPSPATTAIRPSSSPSAPDPAISSILHATQAGRDLSTLPPLPPPTAEEDAALLADLLGGLAIQ
ncbi:hypothetical protein JCM10908_001793 [Rhodotorula pacifica]|uniref:uncharacterized protein n=1 Tax=Rhodotorula pacifica TaxID=1495444 RepID=UPI00317B21DD